jgi:hypothetical protein
MYEELTKMIVKFEKGEMTEVDEIIEFSQQLIDHGLDVSLGGKYSRIVQKLIDQGKVSPEKRLKSIRWLKGLQFD